MASAQTELGKFDDAETTLRAALTLEPGKQPPSHTNLLKIRSLSVCFYYLKLYTGNDVLMKQIKTLKTKKAAAVAASKTKKAPKQLDEATIKEVRGFVLFFACLINYLFI